MKAHRLGDDCLICGLMGGHGTLIAVARDVPVKDRHGRQRTPGHLIDPVLDRVACGTCGVSYESPDRGRYIRELEAELAARKAKDARTPKSLPPTVALHA